MMRQFLKFQFSIFIFLFNYLSTLQINYFGSWILWYSLPSVCLQKLKKFTKLSFCIDMRRQRKKESTQQAFYRYIQQSNHAGDSQILISSPKQSHNFQKQDLDFMEKIKGYGLQTIILEESTSELQKSQRTPKLKPRNQDYLKITSDLDHDFLDYSNLNMKLQSSKNLTKQIKGQILQKIIRQSQYLKNRVVLAKKQNIQLKVIISQFLSQIKLSFKELEKKISEKHRIVLGKHQKTTPNWNQLRKQYQEKCIYINELQNQKNRLIDKISQLHQKNKQLQSKDQQKTRHFQNQILTLQEHNSSLQNQIKNLQKNPMYFNLSKDSLPIDNQPNLKEKYLFMMNKFYGEIQRLQYQLQDIKNKDEIQNQKFIKWRRELEDKELQVKRIAESFDLREIEIEQKQLQLEIKMQYLEKREKKEQEMMKIPSNEGWKHNEEYSPKLKALSIPSIEERMNEPYHLIKKQSFPSFEKVGSSEMLPTNSRKTLSSSSSADLLMNANSFKRLNIKLQKSRKNINILSSRCHYDYGSPKHNAHDKRRATDRNDKNSLTNRISKMQQNIKKQLNQIGYR